jgi:sugar (pentulose or hexulose) kinase
MTTFLGIDIGSTSIKGGVLNLETSAVTCVRQRPFPSPVVGLPSGWFEVDPDAVVTATRDLLDELSDTCGDVSGIVFSCQMGGVILADRLFQPVTRYFSWRDQRTVFADHSRGRSSFDELQQRTSEADRAAVGNELRPGSAVSLLHWLAQYQQLPAAAEVAMNLGDFVVAQLCGAVPRTEPTLALGTLNLRDGTVYRDWFERLGFGQLQWPETFPFDSSVGAIRLPGRSNPVPCYPACGDHQAALLGAGLQEHELSLNISTGSQVSQLTSAIQPGSYQTRPFFGGQFLNTITHLPAGRSLNALTELLTELSTADGHVIRDPWSHIAAAVDRVSKTDLDVNIAFFASSVGDRGHACGMTLENLTVGHLFVGAFINMARNYRQCAERLSPEGRWSQVVLSGGLPQRLPRLQQILQEQFPGPMRMPQIVEESLEGLLRLAEKISAAS